MERIPKEKFNAFYKLYLKSEWWFNLRERKINSVGGKCEVCQSKTKLQVHHLKYWIDNESVFYKENLVDLKCLCDSCHRKEHGITTKGKYTVKKLKTGNPFKYNKFGEKIKYHKKRKHNNKTKNKGYKQIKQSMFNNGTWI